MINLKQMYLCPIGGQLLHQRETSWLTFLTNAQVLISLLLFSAVFSKGVANANVDPVSHRFWEHLEENFFVWAVQCPMCPPNWNCKCAFRSQELALPVAAPPPESR